MDEITKKHLVASLRNPENMRAYQLLNGQNRTAENLPDQLNIRKHFAPAEPAYSLPSANAVDVNRDRLSFQKEGQMLGGNYYAELNKPFNGDVNARVRYLKPHKNGYFEADGNLSPSNSSLFVNYKTNF